MWPNLLDLTKDDCRGILRRSELEAYSQVVSTFRAQGSLNERKSKILKELREIFHINEDRHKAEVRRASNDEELCTIAEKVAGPNTSQEWCLEGRRRYPLIPRDPTLHTALSVIANAAVKNVSPLPPLADNLKEELERNNLPISTNPVVIEDPFSIVNAKKVDMKFSKSPKKRSIEKELTTQPLHTNTRIQQLYHSHSVGSGRTPTKQRKSQTKRQVSIKSKTPVNKPTHRRKLTTVPGGLTEHKPRQKKNQPPKTQTTTITENMLTTSEVGWSNEFIDATTGPPVQIVYTSTPNPAYPRQDDTPNNLITESTPITWLSANSGSATTATTTTMQQNNRLQPKSIIGKNSHLIITDNNAVTTNNNGPRRNFGVNIIEDITLDQLCNIEKSPQLTSSTHLGISDASAIVSSVPNNSSMFPTSTGITPTNVIGPTKPPKIQITNQQILSNKMPIIKSLQSKGNVTLINKDGRMVIKTPNDLSSGSIQKTPNKTESKMDQLIKAVSLTTSPNSSIHQQNAQNANKISLQKLQLVMPNKVRGSTNLVKIYTTSPQPLQTTQLKEKILLPATTQKPSDIVSLSGQENVVVLGVCQTADINANASTINPTDSMITEDTPIDIIASVEDIGEKFDKQQNNVPLKSSTQLLKHLKSPILKPVVQKSNRSVKGTVKSLNTIVVTDTIDVTSDDNDVVSSTDWEVELDHANNCKTQEVEHEDNSSVELTNVGVEDGQSDPIESYLQRMGDDTDDDDDIIQYDETGSPSSLLNEADKM